MRNRQRIVFDNNILVSQLLIPRSTPGQAVRHAVETAQLLVSNETLNELADVLSRPKFDRYVTIGDRQQFLRLLGRVAERVPVIYKVHVCRDQKDNMILELAVNGRADSIVTGDEDLLVLSPFQSIPIITPARYLEVSLDDGPTVVS